MKIIMTLFTLIIILLLAFNVIAGCGFYTGNDETGLVSLWSCRESEWSPTSEEWRCKSKIDFSNQAALDTLPLEIEGWQTYEGDQALSQVLEHEDQLWQKINHDRPSWLEITGADTFLLRQYVKSNVNSGTQSVWLLIMYSEGPQNLNYPLEIFYPSQGWGIFDESHHNEIQVTHPSWHEDLQGTCIRASKLVVGKVWWHDDFSGIDSETAIDMLEQARKEGTAEHRMALYFYIDDDPATPEVNGLIRVSTNMPAYSNNYYKQTEDTLKEYLATIFPYVFEPIKN